MVAQTIRQHLDEMLTLPGARASTMALGICGEFRKALLAAAEKQADEDEKQRLKNLAAALPQWGA